MICVQLVIVSFFFVNGEMMKNNKKNIYVITWSLFYYKMLE